MNKLGTQRINKLEKMLLLNRMESRYTLQL